MIKYEVIPQTSEVCLEFEGSQIGRCKLWIPEGIVTPGGIAGTYPRGMRWMTEGAELRQEATVGQVFGPGNVEEIEPGVLDCCGVRYTKEPPVPWKTVLTFDGTSVDFSVEVQNPHSVVLPHVCALLCLKFMDAHWWDLESCFIRTEAGVKNLGEIRWIDGKFPNFQKWNIGPDAPYDNPVQNGIWTSNAMHATAPQWVVVQIEAGLAVRFQGEAAYYIHCNRGNPCNDIALKFRHLRPGERCVRRGSIEFLLTDTTSLQLPPS